MCKRSRQLLITVLVIVIMGGVYWTEFTGRYICGVCGRARDMTSIFGIPVHANIKETELSRAVERAGLVGEHEHEWIFVHGRGISGVSGSGRGGSLERVMERPLYGQFLEATARHRGREEARAWLELMLDPQHSGDLCTAIDSTWDAPEAFSDAGTYDELYEATIFLLECVGPLPSGLDSTEASEQ